MNPKSHEPIPKAERPEAMAPRRDSALRRMSSTAQVAHQMQAPVGLQFISGNACHSSRLVVRVILALLYH